MIFNQFIRPNPTRQLRASTRWINRQESESIKFGTEASFETRQARLPANATTYRQDKFASYFDKAPSGALRLTSSGLYQPSSELSVKRRGWSPQSQGRDPTSVFPEIFRRNQYISTYSYGEIEIGTYLHRLLRWTNLQDTKLEVGISIYLRNLYGEKVYSLKSNLRRREVLHYFSLFLFSDRHQGERQEQQQHYYIISWTRI